MVCAVVHCVERHPVAGRKLPHELEVQPGAETVIRHEGLVEPCDGPQAIEQLCDAKRTKVRAICYGPLAHHQESDEIGEGELC